MFVVILNPVVFQRSSVVQVQKIKIQAYEDFISLKSIFSSMSVKFQSTLNFEFLQIWIELDSCQFLKFQLFFMCFCKILMWSFMFHMNGNSNQWNWLQDFTVEFKVDDYCYHYQWVLASIVDRCNFVFWCRLLFSFVELLSLLSLMVNLSMTFDSIVYIE